MRWVLLALTVPIAIAANGIRVALTGILSEVNTQLAQGLYHETEGFIVFVIALIALILSHSVVKYLAKKLQKA